MIKGTMSSEQVGNARIWTLKVPVMPAPGQLIEWSEPAVGMIPARTGVRGWVSSEPSTRPDTVLVTVATEGSRWTVVTLTDIIPHLTHDLDYGYAEVVSSEGLTGDVASYCRTCDATIHHAPIDDETDGSHDVRDAPTVTRPYQARPFHYLGRLAYVSNPYGNRLEVFTQQGTYGRSPGRLVCQTYRSR